MTLQNKEGAHACAQAGRDQPGDVGRQQRSLLVQFRASENERVQLREAAKARGFVDEHGEPVVATYLRALIKADRGAGAVATPMDARGHHGRRSREGEVGPPAMPVLPPAAIEVLRSYLGQVSGVSNNLNQLMRDVHLVRRGVSPSAPVTQERVQAVLIAIERDLHAPLKLLLGRRPAAADAHAMPAPVAQSATAERFQRRTGPRDPQASVFVRHPERRG